MAVVTTYTGWPWPARALGLVALILVILALAVPGTPEWLMGAAVALVAIGLMLR